MEQFWMVYVDGGDSPRHQHTSYQSAKEEAERLARKEGRRVFVLLPINFVEATVQLAWSVD